MELELERGIYMAVENADLNKCCKYIEQCPCCTAMCKVTSADTNCIRLLLAAYHHKGYHAVDWEDKKEKLHNLLSEKDGVDEEKILRLFEKWSTHI